MLVMPKAQEQQTPLRIRVSASLLKEIADYCRWAGIHSRDYFFEQACQYIFDRDTDWQALKK